MKTLPYLLAATLLSAFISCQKEPESGYPDNISALLEQIADPPAKYRTAPLWDWNDKINREDIAFQLEQFKKGGLGGVFIHPRPGLVTEYLSDDWNELFAYTVKTGKELGCLEFGKNIPNTIAVDPKNRFWIIATKDRTLRFFRLNNI